tara:strand:+ start:849 stop:1058 length:210 start_codon:yes stop_codon:yes gene_type:complete
MVMQYLVSRNEEYLRHIENFDTQIGEIRELIQVLEYNILGLKQQLTDFTDKESDDKRKETWFAKQQETI